MEKAVSNKSVVGAAGVRLFLIVAPAIAGDATGITEIEPPFRIVHIAAGTVELIAPDKIRDGVDGRSPAVKNSEDQQRADSQR